MKSLNTLGPVIGMVVCLAAPLAHANAVKDKFNGLVTSIETELTTYGGDADKIDALSAGSLRQSLFTIETVSDLYANRYAGFGTIHDITKSLEDQVGAYRKTIEQYDYAKASGADESRLKSLKDRREQGRQYLASVLDRFQNGGQLSKVKSILAKTSWKNGDEDKRYTYAALSTQVQTIDDTNWNMGVLEGGGIHDLRKAVRWYRLEVAAFADIIGTQNQTCGQGAIPPTDPESGGKCVISACLHDHMGRIYDTFGAIKDEGEGQEGLGGHLAQAKMDEANQLYKETKSKNIFGKLADEFKTCASK